MPETETDLRPRRRWFRFSLRTLFALATLACVLFGWIAKERRQSAHEMEIAETLRAQGWRVDIGGRFDSCDATISPALPAQTWWQRGAERLLGQRIYIVSSKDWKGPVACLIQLAPLVGARSLGGLRLELGEADDLRPLAEFKQLESLIVCNACMRDLAPLASLRKVRVLVLHRFEADDLRPLTELTQLTRLIIDCPNVRDLTPLKALENLEWLNIAGRPVTQAEMDELQTALPNCRIRISHD